MAIQRRKKSQFWCTLPLSCDSRPSHVRVASESRPSHVRPHRTQCFFIALGLLRNPKFRPYECLTTMRCRSRNVVASYNASLAASLASRAKYWRAPTRSCSGILLEGRPSNPCSAKKASCSRRYADASISCATVALDLCDLHAPREYTSRRPDAHRTLRFSRASLS